MMLCPLISHWEFCDVGLITGFNDHPEASVIKPHVSLNLPGSVAINNDCLDQFFLRVLQSGEVLILSSVLHCLAGILLQRRTFPHQLLVTLKVEKKAGTLLIIALLCLLVATVFLKFNTSHVGLPSMVPC